MLTNIKIKDVFPGGNTAYGFFSFYDYIIGPEAKRIFILKGGPGVGKSTLMRQIGEEILQRGYDIEFHHCSSDNNSLDGVVIPAIKIALIDGTAPHIVDPKNPGAIDEIVNLGDYWNENDLRAHREAIIEHNLQISSWFQRAYRYLAAAKSVRDNILADINAYLDKSKLYKISEDIIGTIINGNDLNQSNGKQRHLFGSAITPDGLIDYLDTIITPQPTRYILAGEVGTGKSYILNRICEAATAKGYDVEVYHCALVPDEIEHVIVPKLGVAITSSEKFINTSSKVYDLNSCLDMDKFATLEQRIKEDYSIVDNLISQAVKNIAAAKEIHDHMETYYIPNMDFETVRKVRDKLLQRILEYAKELSS